MKRGKDDDKRMGPMFPRLHVNDAEKGGPRAPPRNKMALYEQLSTPSHRFNHGVLPPNTSEINMVPAASTSQGSGTGRNLRFSHHVLSSTPPFSHVAEMLHSQQPDDGNSNTSSTQLEQRRKVGDEDDFMVPVFVHSSLGKSQNGSDRETPTIFDSNHLVCSKQIQNTGDNNENNNTGIGTNPRQDRKNQNDERLEVSVSGRDHSVRSPRSSLTREKIARPENASLNQQGDFSRLCKDDVCLQQEPTVLLQQNDSRHGESVSELTREIEKRNNPGPIAVSDSYSGDDLNCQGEAEIDSKCHRDETCRSQEFVNGEKSDDISETSMVDSITEVTFTPDDVVGMIGQKRFWKARRAIVNQQRLFALQVFELHKLIKVQRLISASPHLLLENSGYLGKPSSKKLPSEYVLMPPGHVAKCKNDSDKQNHEKEHSAENGVEKASFSLVKNGSQPYIYGPYLGNPTPIPMPTDSKLGPWCFNLSLGNQLLVPVMSPSEGLVYKPYTAPGVMESSGGGQHPFGAIPFNGNFINPCYGVPASHHPHGNGVIPGFPPVGHGYFPPYAMPSINPPVYGSAVEQMNCVLGSRSQGHSGGLSGVGANFNLQHQSSSKVLTKKRGSISQVIKPRASRESGVPRRTASSPSEKVQKLGTVGDAEEKDAIHPFPMAPATPEGPLETGQQTRVIKVVPHNPRSATESVARIFQSIQEERKKYDSN
ncbi:protein EARLY FLOWERING 3 [Euphorbia lathyris]|uniref:protein EARLY FLOWERING 3 n=1 Tax=Euphorbia lathyris TaxID=212925 RepID=UPI003313503F